MVCRNGHVGRSVGEELKAGADDAACCRDFLAGGRHMRRHRKVVTKQLVGAVDQVNAHRLFLHEFDERAERTLGMHERNGRAA